MMLVLQRKIGESVVIDEEVVITLMEVRGRRVRLGILAPKEISIRRAELAARRPIRDGFSPVDELAMSY